MKTSNFDLLITVYILVAVLSILCMAFANSWTDWLVVPAGVAGFAVANWVWGRKS